MHYLGFQYQRILLDLTVCTFIVSVEALKTQHRMTIITSEVERLGWMLCAESGYQPKVLGLIQLHLHQNMIKYRIMTLPKYKSSLRMCHGVNLYFLKENTLSIRHVVSIS